MSNKLYQVSYSKSDGAQITIDVTKSLKIGSDSTHDLVINGDLVAPLQGKLRLQGDVLTYTHLCDASSTSIGPQECGKGKMYILDEGDVFTIGATTISIQVNTSNIENEDKHSTNELTLSDLNLDEDSGQFSGQIDKRKDSRGFQIDEESDALNMDNYEPAGNTLLGIEVIEPGDPDKDILEDLPINKKKTPTQQSPPSSLGKLKKQRSTKKRLSVEQEQTGQKAKRSKAFEKTSEIQRLQKMSKKRARFSPDAASILPRLIGTLYNVLFFGLFFFYTDYLQHPVILDLAKQLENILSPVLSDLAFLPSWSHAIIKHPTFYQSLLSLFIWDILSSLLLGVNVGQFLVGLKAKADSALLTRLLSPIRIILGIVTAPFLLFDAPCLFSKRTFKEILTRTIITTRSSFLTMTSSFILMPLLFVLVSNYHFITESKYLEQLLDDPRPSILVDLNKDKTAQAEASPELTKKWLMQSRALGIEVSALLKKNLFIYPQMTNNTEANYLQFLLYDEQSNQSIKISGRQVIATEPLKNLLKRDPLLFYTYPTLFEQYQGKTQTNLSLDSNIIEKIFETSTLTNANLLAYVKKHGFFTKPSFDLTAAVKEKMRVDTFHDLELFKNKLNYSMSFKKHAKEHKRYLLTINDLGLFLFTVESNKPKDLLAKDFIKDVLSSTVRLEKPIGSQSELINIFSKINREGSITTNQSLAIIKSYTELGRSLIQGTSNEGHLELVLQVFKNNEKALLRSLKKRDDKNISELRLALNRIQKALYKRETEFFQLN